MAIFRNNNQLVVKYMSDLARMLKGTSAVFEFKKIGPNSENDPQNYETILQGFLAMGYSIVSEENTDPFNRTHYLECPVSNSGTERVRLCTSQFAIGDYWAVQTKTDLRLILARIRKSSEFKELGFDHTQGREWRFMHIKSDHIFSICLREVQLFQNLWSTGRRS